MDISNFPDPPYPNDTMYKGWRFELDLQRITQSDTWALASPVEQAWLLKLWVVAWQQNPCGTLPPDDLLIAARLAMPLSDFMASKEVLLRGWRPANDGRLYHQVMSERVLDMLTLRNKERDRKAAYREREKDERRAGNPNNARSPLDSVPVLSHGTDVGLTRPSHGIDPVRDDTSTRTRTSKPKVKDTVAFATEGSFSESIDAHAEPEGDRQRPAFDDTGDNAEGVAHDDDEPVARVTAEDIAKIFDYWRETMKSPLSKLDDKRRGVIRRALKNYAPRDICRAIQGCSLTPHNQGDNERGQKYIGIHVVLKDADQIDRFIANAVSPPVAPVKKTGGAWFRSHETALAKAIEVGAGPARNGESKDAWHGRIQACIDNGGKPPAPVAPTPRPVAPPEAPRVLPTKEQAAQRSAALRDAMRHAVRSPAGVASSVAVPANPFLAGVVKNIPGVAVQ